MSLLSSSRFLRNMVWFDAATGIILGTLHVLLPALMSDWLGLPQGLLVVSGVMLLGYAALAISIARAKPMPRGRLTVLIIGNFSWALASLVLVLGSALDPTGLGKGYLAMHVVSVALLAELQWMGARRLPVLSAA